MLSYCGGGVKMGGGGSSSEKAGGLKEGTLRRCIGLTRPAFGSLKFGG